MVRSSWGVSLARILAVLEVGAGGLACGGNAETSGGSRDEAEAGYGGASDDGPVGSGATSSGGQGEVTGEGGGVSVSGGTGGTGPRFPIDPAEFEGVADQDLLDALVEYDPEVLGTLCTSPEPDVYMWQYACLQLADDGDNCSDVFRFDQAAALYSCGLQEGADEVCGPARPSANQCCYFVGGDCPIGRPFFVNAQARIAAAENRSDWLEGESPDISALDEKTKKALAKYYLEEGLGEHASVAAFSRFVLQCLAHGAPADIVEAAIVAAREEVQHAKFAFGLASHFAGEPQGAGSLDVTGALGGATELGTVILSTVREGCIAETVSAHLLAAARDSASDPVVKKGLSLIFEQEMAHALLAWRFVVWALGSESLSREARSQLLKQMEKEFRRAESSVGFGPLLPEEEEAEANSAQLLAHGYLPQKERMAVARSVLSQVVRPAAATLLRSVHQSPRVHSGRRAIWP